MGCGGSKPGGGADGSAGPERQPTASDELDDPTGAAAGGAPEPPLGYSLAMWNEVEHDYMAGVLSASWIARTWDEIAGHTTRMISLAVISEWIGTKFPQIVNDVALRAAYGMICMLDGEGDAWVVPAEFPRVLATFFFTSKLFACFEVTGGEKEQIEKERFQIKVTKLGLDITGPAELTSEWRHLQTHNKKKKRRPRVSHLVQWYLKCVLPEDELTECCQSFLSSRDVDYYLNANADARGWSASTRDNRRRARLKISEIEDELMEFAHDADKVHREWEKIANNSGGVVSQAITDKEYEAWLENSYPAMLQKVPLERAFIKTVEDSPTRIEHNGATSNWILPVEFPLLLNYTVYFNRVFRVYENFDADNDTTLDIQEFEEGLGSLGVKLTTAEIEQTFKSMLDIDTSGGGVIFDKFCDWYVKEYTAKGRLKDTTAQFVANRDLDFYLI